MSAMMATNSLASRHGCIHLSLLTAGGRLRSWSGAPAIPGHLPPRPGAPSPSPSPSAGNAPLTERVADNASILEMLSSEATEEIYYL